MGRTKTVSDDAILKVARDHFRREGHTATTRDIAKSVRLSEAVLYQRFGDKNTLFFAAMQVTGPDIEQLLGPPVPESDALSYIESTVERVAVFYADVIPLALRVMMHPSFDPANLGRVAPGGGGTLRDAFATRLTALAKRGELPARSSTLAAKLFLSLAHDWGVGKALAPSAAPRDTCELKNMVRLVWQGLKKSQRDG